MLTKTVAHTSQSSLLEYNHPDTESISKDTRTALFNAY